MIMQKEKQKQMSQLENEAHLAKVKSQADAEFYHIQKQAEANKVGRRVIRLLVYCAGIWRPLPLELGVVDPLPFTCTCIILTHTNTHTSSN